jgi:hypothetical protein
VAPLSATGELAAFVGAAAGTVHFILDVSGYLAAGTPPLPTVAFMSAASSGGEATTLANLAGGLRTRPPTATHRCTRCTS